MKKAFFLFTLVISSPAFAGYFGDMQRNTPSIHRGAVDHLFPGGRTSSSTSSSSTGTSISTNRTERVAGTDIPINAKSDYTRSAISAAAVAAAALCGSNPLTAIICGAAIQYGLEKGIKQCEESGWCKTETVEEHIGEKYYSVNGYPYATSANAACQSAGVPAGYSAHADSSVGGGYCILVKNDTGAESYWKNWNSGTCPMQTTSTEIARICGLTPDNTPWQPGEKPSSPPWADPGFPPYLDGRQGNEPNFGPQIAGEATGAGHPPQSSPSGGPTVTAEPRTGEPTVKTESIPKSDGSTDIRTTSSTPTVTPKIENNNTPAPKVSYKVDDRTVITTINNQTNKTEIETRIETRDNQSPEMELPDDYNKEVTQREIADELAGKNAPAAPADQALRTKTEIAKTDSSLKDLFDGLPGKFTADKENWFSWVWTPPGGTCNSSDYSGTVHGYAVTWDICPTVSKIREVLGFLFALFGAYIIYGQIFKGSKS